MYIKRSPNVRRFRLSLLFFLLTALIYLLARCFPQIMFPWYQEFSRRAMALWADLTDLLPFSLLEWGGLGLIWLALGWTVKVISRRRGLGALLSAASLILSVILLLFIGLWGADQFAPTFTSTTDYTETTYSLEEATEAAEYYLAMANRYALTVSRDETGAVDFGNFSAIAEKMDSGYRYLEQTYGPRFAIGHVRPKGLVFSRLMDLCGLTGIYTAYTGEMGVNVDTPAQSLPFTICHECAHRTTVTQESDANFVSFLACIHSDSEQYLYSGYYSAFIYCYNAIAKVDKETQRRLWNGMNDALKGDILAANAHYAEFDRPMKRAAQKVNDSYLKSFNQPTGVENYGAVAGPMIGYYLLELAPAESSSAG